MCLNAVRLLLCQSLRITNPVWRPHDYNTLYKTDAFGSVSCEPLIYSFLDISWLRSEQVKCVPASSPNPALN